MLTPPGLKGKQYRITGTAYPRLRRPHQRRRHVLIAIAGVLTLSVLTWGTVQLVDVFGGGKHATAATACVRALSARLPDPGSADSLVAPPGTPGAAVGRASGAVSGPPSGSASAGASGAAAPPGAAAAKGITVNVYNATDKAGLAGRTAALLKQRGFTIGTVGNAPAQLQDKVTGTARITGGAAGTKAVTVLRSEVAGAVPATDQRKDASVDLVLGNGFTALATPDQAAQALALAAGPAPSASAHC
ncbi:LytR C-terminal domain-containing protein [Streptacidiphilus sp. P02-A3a]|uniref:LytR C-terminal domain-containing protein n=1 Tax=Streptacidiphilus sp. P02-A3a TaxID=2704468 RepID=UPI0015FD05E7|nr:LytR C-terminal domain-containing protein [Streptacidiphilus sp. P02-A3a]QMU67011.1 LytR C-terminal domain-containing protein [Streptacidiphilus sp. P02-A3a]